MTTTLKTLVCGLLLILSFSIQASTLSSPQKALEFSNAVVMNISRGRFDDAWRSIKENASIPQGRINEFAREYDSHYVRTIQHFGPSTGVELIGKDMSGKSMLRVTYLVKYEITGVAWYMYFYRVRDSWVLSEFNYDLNSSSIFKQMDSAKESSDTDLLLGLWQNEVEKRLASLEKDQNNQNLSQPIITDNIELGDTEMAVLAALEARLATIENGLAETQQRLADVDETATKALQKTESGNVYSLSDELEFIKRTIAALKKQHPYGDFPVQ
ncbi:MAG: hypothetical protein AB7U63_19475 [Porticoccaceae bacterium]